MRYLSADDARVLKKLRREGIKLCVLAEMFGFPVSTLQTYINATAW